jgi:excinuclease UvrABC nuclease subunit
MSEIKIGSKSFKEWQEKWISIGQYKNVNLSKYNKNIGIYKIIVDREVVYIGRAVEYDNGGFRKRLSDYTRKSVSSRKYSSGGKINKNIKNADIEIIIVGNDLSAVETTKRLEHLMIAIHWPKWNRG